MSDQKNFHKIVVVEGDPATAEEDKILNTLSIGDATSTVKNNNKLKLDV